MSLIEEVVKRVEELARRMTAIETQLEMQDTLAVATDIDPTMLKVIIAQLKVVDKLTDEQRFKLETIQSMLADIAGTLHAQNAKLNAITETLTRLQG